MKSLKKTILYLSLLLVFTVVVASCSTDADEYYIKYVVGITPGDEVDITYSDTYNQRPHIQRIVNESTFEAIVGPTYGGFNATLSATVNGGTAPAFVRIESSLNGAPYTVQAEKNGSTSVSWAIPLEDHK